MIKFLVVLWITTIASKSTRVKEISLEFTKQYGGLNLIPGQKLCYRCKKPIEDLTDIPDGNDKYDSDYSDTGNDYEVVKSAEKLCWVIEWDIDIYWLFTTEDSLKR